MKTQNSNLAFAKHIVVELNSNQLYNIKGGTITYNVVEAITRHQYTE